MQHSSVPLLGQLQRQLAALADPVVARGQDAYFKGVIQHRGIKTPAVDAVCKEFLRGSTADVPELQQLGLALLSEPLQEDKLAGVNVLQHCLLKGGRAAQWRAELAALQEVYLAGHVFAWSTCDWVCGRLLGPLIKQLLRGSMEEGEACSRAIMSWRQQDNLWLRRTSVVAFVTLARQPDEQVFPGFRSALLDTLAVTVRGPERFAQTGTGWVLREVGKGDTDQLLQFVDSNLQHFSREGLRYALEQQPASVRQQFMDRHKQPAAAAAVAGGQAQQGGGHHEQQGQQDDAEQQQQLQEQQVVARAQRASRRRTAGPAGPEGARQAPAQRRQKTETAS